MSAAFKDFDDVMRSSNVLRQNDFSAAEHLTITAWSVWSAV
jgi:hypothetical protein